MADNVLQCSRISHHSIFDGATPFTIANRDIITDLEVPDLMVNEFGFNEGEKAIYARIGDDDIRELQTTITSKITVGTGSGTYSIMSFDLVALGIQSISFNINALAYTSDGYNLNSVSQPFVVLGTTFSGGAGTVSVAGIISPTGLVEKKFPSTGNNLGIVLSVTGSVFDVSIATANKAGSWKIKTTMNTLFNDVTLFSGFATDGISFTNTDGTITYP